MSATPRLYLPVETLRSNLKIVLCANQHNYLRQVMRIKEGDAVIVFNGVDGDWNSEVEFLSKKETSVILKSQICGQKKIHDLTLYFAPIKAVTCSWISQKATELLSTKIQPIFTERSVIRKVNVEKMEIASHEAAEQSERTSIPAIFEPIALSALAHDGNLFFCDERAEIDNSFYKILLTTKMRNDAILVGPEGGFSDSEKTMLLSRGAIPVSLGPQILRAETASIAALSTYVNVRYS